VSRIDGALSFHVSGPALELRQLKLKFSRCKFYAHFFTILCEMME
jgi:hypothetical protein